MEWKQIPNIDLLEANTTQLEFELIGLHKSSFKKPAAKKSYKVFCGRDPRLMISRLTSQYTVSFAGDAVGNDYNRANLWQLALATVKL